MLRSFRELTVWQKSMQLATAIYKLTQGFPREETYGLASQLRRAAVSIPSNIAEGKGRSTDRDRNLFFCHARGSLLELQTQILIAQRLKFLEASAAGELTNLTTGLGRMLNALIQSMRDTDGRRSPAA